MNILGIVPARKGSKRVPGKNTKPLSGIPLINYVLKASSNSCLLGKIVVTSDDDEIRELVNAYRNISFIRRPDELATDVSPAIDYVNHALNQLRDNVFDVIVIIQPTTPFVNTEDIDGTVKLLLENSGANSAVSVVKIDQVQHPLKLKTMEGNILRPFLKDEGGIKAAHELPDVYTRNGAVYATRLSTIKQGQIIGEVCAGYVMPPERSIDINNPIDFEFAEFLTMKRMKGC